MLKAIKSNASMTASQVIAYRAAFFKKWTKRAAELHQKEKELHSTLPKHHQQILRGKRLLLMEDMLTHFGYQDSGIVKEIIQGFDLVGTLLKLPLCLRLSNQLLSRRMMYFQVANRAIHGCTNSSGNLVTDTELYRKSM